MIISIAIDDEPIALDIINMHAQKIHYLHLERMFLSATEALDFLESTPIDLVFLDINMPDVSGLEFASRTKAKTQVIFTTAHAEHALKGFDLAATDYLLKPINFSRFSQACQLAHERKQQISIPDRATEESLFVKDGYSWVQIILTDILYIQGQDNYVCIAEQDRKTLTRMTLGEIQNKLPRGQFLRVHKSYMVPLPKIIRIESHQIIIKGIKIPLSRSYREYLLKHLNTFKP